MATPRQTHNNLLRIVQEGIPLHARPFEAIGQQLGISEEEALDALRQLRLGEKPDIRQISAIFDTKALGYESSLVAAQVPEDRVDAAAEIISAHPGVSHNYKRNHRYNLWYTLAVPPDSRLGLERTVQSLHRQSGAEATRLMPTLKLFKIGVKFDLSGEADVVARSQAPHFVQADREQASAFRVTDADKRMIRVLQQDLPLVPRPFDQWARQAEVAPQQLLASAQRYLQNKQMRRFSAVLHHRAAGFRANGMGVWIVPPEKQEQFGQTAATFDAVSHCYLRPTYEDWPYSMFTMVHAPSMEQCQEVLAAISQATGVTEYAPLYSTKEYKKVRVKYFTPETEAWEEQELRRQGSQ
jgi:DNA-binding Lrp family transcriptional regulator